MRLFSCSHAAKVMRCAAVVGARARRAPRILVVSYGLAWAVNSLWFGPCTCCSDKQAIECLRHAEWSVEGGIDVFYSSGMQVRVTVRATAFLFTMAAQFGRVYVLHQQ